MNYKHFREKNAKFHIFLLLSIMGGISLITIYDRKFSRLWLNNRPGEGLPKMITYISPINMVAEDNHLYFAYKSPLGVLWYLIFFHYFFLIFDITKKISILSCRTMASSCTMAKSIRISRRSSCSSDAHSGQWWGAAWSSTSGRRLQTTTCLCSATSWATWTTMPRDTSCFRPTATGTELDFGTQLILPRRNWFWRIDWIELIEEIELKNWFCLEVHSVLD